MERKPSKHWKLRGSIRSKKRRTQLTAPYQFQRDPQSEWRRFLTRPAMGPSTQAYWATPSSAGCPRAPSAAAWAPGTVDLRTVRGRHPAQTRPKPPTIKHAPQAEGRPDHPALRFPFANFPGLTRFSLLPVWRRSSHAELEFGSQVQDEAAGACHGKVIWIPG